MRGSASRAAWAAVCASLATPAPAAAEDPGDVQLHGFVSQGGFVSTANEYIGRSSRGSLAFFEAALNASSEPAERLRVGIQMFARKVGDYETEPRIDWAYADYAWRPWLAVRVGTIKIPLGLYNEFVDVDAARLPILLPQSLYSIRSRDVTTSYTGLGVYGERRLSCYGSVGYHAWFGTLSIPESALDISGASLEGSDVRYATGVRGQWSPPIEGVRAGASVVRAAVDFDLRLDQMTTEALIAAGLAPADFDGRIGVNQRPITIAIASVEYARDAWLLAAEYGRQWVRQSYEPALAPDDTVDQERFYAMGAYRPGERIEFGAYASVLHLSADDRLGRDRPPGQRHHAFQRDYAATLRVDLSPVWTWKVEAHVVDGVADLNTEARAGSDRFWGLFLFKTTVTF